MTMRVSVVVPHYQDPASLDACLTALTAQTFPKADHEIVVADNASPMGEAAVAKVIAGRARLTIAPEKGAGPARNGGVAAAAGELLAFTDCDCVPEPGWLAAGIAALQNAPIIGGRMTVSTSSARTGPEVFETLFAFDNEDYVTRKGFTVTANLFCARTTFDAVGPFRTGVSEDTEWCWRARDMGYAIAYAPDAAVAHPARPDWPSLVKKWGRISEESFLLAKSRGERWPWLAKQLAMPLSIVAHAPRVFAAQGLSAGERAGALITLARIRLWRFGDAVRLALK
ncbi:Glycosyltransferase 2-like domain-containing protein [Sphingomonas antarctica]|uniref:glycosyltransferase family 2 protein n=1 Tax=Sphingomonas antarctica TaxID=2040274 RepID=UPI0039E97442